MKYCVKPNENNPLAERLARRLSLSMSEEGATHVLEYLGDRLQLRATRYDAPGALCVDFVAGGLARRARQSGKRNELIARAVGLKPNQPPPSILDATAGLGKDAFILASLGCHVTLCEVSPIVAALLEDGLRRARADETIAHIMANLHFVGGDAIKKMQDSVALYDVVYLDPMFSEASKSALVKKDMQLLQEIVGKAEAGELLFSAAQPCAIKRIVVKRHRLARGLVDLQPSHAIIGKTGRFDVYMMKG